MGGGDGTGRVSVPKACCGFSEMPWKAAGNRAKVAAMDGTPLPLTFRGFRFHPDTGRLEAADGGATVLRPKTAALLGHLLGRRGAVVSKEELLDAVWPDVTVTEDSITQCVGEIRRAMGEEGRFLRTLPRRGYVLEAGEGVEERAAAEAAPVPPIEPISSSAAATPRWALPAAGAGLVAAAILALSFRGPSLVASAPPAAAPTTSVVGSPPPISPDPRGEAARLTDEARRLITAPGNARTNWLNARTLAERAIALNPVNPESHAVIVPTYTNMVLNGYSLNPVADLREAEQHAERAITLGPNLAPSHSALGAVLRQQGRWEAARVAYLRASELGPTQHASRANAALMLILLGQPDEAIAPVQATLALTRPDHSFRYTWLTYLGLAELHRGNWAEAVDNLRDSMGGRSFMPVAPRTALLAAAMQRSGAAPEDVVAVVTRVRASDATVGADWFRRNPLSRAEEFQRRQEPVLRAMEDAGLP